MISAGARAVVPYFVLERHSSYLGVSGLAMAATLGSAMPQRVIGVLADLRQLRWMAPLGLSLAGTGAGPAGVVPSNGLVWLMLLASGLGWRCSTRRRPGRQQAAGNSATAMSYSLRSAAPASFSPLPWSSQLWMRGGCEHRPSFFPSPRGWDSCSLATSGAPCGGPRRPRPPRAHHQPAGRGCSPR